MIRRLVQRLREKWTYWQSWEEVGRRLEYNTVVKQASGYSITVDEVVMYENAVDGAERERKVEEGSVWYTYDSWWSPGKAVKYKGEIVQAGENCGVFGGVARGYQR